MAMTAEKRQLSGNARTPLATTPLAGSVVAALVASLCCGGSLVFASIGLGALYASLSLSRYIPQVLAAGTLTIVAINWLFYRRQALAGGLSCDSSALRRAMYVSVVLGLAMMAGSFLFVEWLNHGIVNAARFMHEPDHAGGIIPGVSNQNLLYAVLSFAGVGVLRALPFPNQSRAVPA